MFPFPAQPATARVWGFLGGHGGTIPGLFVSSFARGECEAAEKGAADRGTGRGNRHWNVMGDREGR